jgi:crotonobetainyl-CoA:carnitine CoA-transferase CaiB-like acyl-CoA transferase
MGARVIKVERTVTGDQERNVEGSFSVINAGKESLAINLATNQGREIIHRLISQADILIESFQPGTTVKLGIDYATVSKLKDDIIYCSITGYGQTGPLSPLPAHNISITAEAGVLGMGGRTGEPPEESCGVYVADLSASMFAAVSVLGAVVQKVREGKGAYIDIAMGDCCVSWVSGVWGEYNNGLTNEQVLFHPAHGIFEAKDGKYLAIAAVAEGHWPILCEALNFRDYLENPEFNTVVKRRPFMEIINNRIAETIKTKKREYWLDLLRSRGIAANPVTTAEELAEHKHFIERGLLDTSKKMLPAAGVAFPAVVNNERWGRDRSPAPSLGQDSAAILKSMGYSDEEIDNLSADGIIEDAF